MFENVRRTHNYMRAAVTRVYTQHAKTRNIPSNSTATPRAMSVLQDETIGAVADALGGPVRRWGFDSAEARAAMDKIAVRAGRLALSRVINIC